MPKKLQNNQQKSSTGFSTKAIHLERDPSKQYGAVNNGIFQTSTVIFETYEDFLQADRVYYNKGRLNPQQNTYGRNGTQTIFECERAIASLYNGDFCKMTSCGYTACITAINAFTKAGCHILISDGVYGPTRSFVQKTLKKYGVESTFYNPSTTPQELEQLIQSNTSLIYMESPSSLTFEVQDIAGICAIAKKNSSGRSIPTILDNTFFTAYNCQPFSLGVDVVVEACTKFMSGHSDVMAGAIIFDENFALDIISSYREIGANTTGMVAYSILRGIRTLKPRLDAHTKSIDEVINAIQNHNAIEEIRHPSQTACPGYQHFQKQYTGYTSLFSIVFKKKYSEEVMSKFFNRLEYFGMGYSWGGYESLTIQFPEGIELMRNHYSINPEKTCIRIYIGLEDASDLIQDLITSLNLL